MDWHRSSFFALIFIAVIGFDLVQVFAYPVEEDRYDTSTLQLVHVLFRHGDRAPDSDASYPNDPYINETYQPYGHGQLTNKGKQKEFAIGKAVRKRYDQFLGDIYTINSIEPVSTELNRTKMSLALFLASLYPPKRTVLEWNNDLNWQPIPTNYRLFAEDGHLLSFAIQYCNKYIQLYTEYFQSPEGVALQKKYAKLYGYLTKHTGQNVTNLIQIFVLGDTLASQQSFGLKLPAWTNEVYPDALDEAVGDFFASSMSTPLMKQLSGGFLLKKIIADTRAKIANALTPKEMKMFVYSAHDVNVAQLLSVMNVYDHHQPPFGAFVLIEVHKIKNVDGVKIFYQNYAQVDPKPLTIPGCTQFCPFDKFVQLLQDSIPSDDNNPCGDK